MSETTQTEIIPVPERPEPISNLLAPFTQSSVPVSVSNFDKDGIENWELSVLATGEQCKSGADFLGEVIEMKYFYVHQVTLTDERGKPQDLPRVVIIDVYDVAYGFISQGIFDYLRMMIHHVGEGPWLDGMPVVIKSLKTRKGFRYFTLEPAREKPEAIDEKKS